MTTHITIPKWLIGFSGPLLGALVAGAVTWGVATVRFAALETHVINPTVHVNAALLEYQLEEIKDDVAEIKVLLTRSP